MFQLAPKIIKLYRVPSSSSSESGGRQVSFVEFLRYIVDSRWHPHSDFHWASQTELCNPCAGRRGSGRLTFDFVGHYETLYEDADYIVRKLGIKASGSLFDQQHRNRSRADQWQDQVRAAFASVPADIKAKLKALYRFDFEALGYDPNII